MLNESHCYRERPRQRRPQTRHTVVGVLLALATIGCSERGQELAPVSGVVELDGKPLTGFQHGGVALTPKGGRLATGVISPTDGTFQLSTYRPGDGAVIGSATISVSATVGDSSAAGKIEGRHQQVKSVIPAQFSDRDASELTYKVVDGENFLRIKLDSDGNAVIEDK